MTTLYLTVKQIQLLTTLLQTNDDGSFLDLDQVLERLPYRTTKASIHFSIRPLIRHGLVKKHETELRRGQNRRVLSLTTLGYKLMGRFDEPGKSLPEVTVDENLM